MADADEGSAMLQLRKDAIKSAELEVKNFPGLLERSFILTKYAGNSHESSEFRVMQWNVLADGKVQVSTGFQNCLRECRNILIVSFIWVFMLPFELFGVTSL